MNFRICKFGRASRKYLRSGLLERVGAQAAGCHGHQIAGAFGTFSAAVQTTPRTHAFLGHARS
eukprot:2519421-Pyramimonas_sp.AAC.1